MSQFSTKLQVLLERLSLSQAEVARSADMRPSLFNGYYQGSHRPTPDALDKILQAFDTAERAELVVAHLRDETPASAADLVRIVNLIESPRTAEPHPRPKIELPPSLEKDFEFLMRYAQDHPEVGRWIKSTVDVVRGA